MVNARHVKRVPVRKRDVTDSQWLAALSRSAPRSRSCAVTGPGRGSSPRAAVRVSRHAFSATTSPPAPNSPNRDSWLQCRRASCTRLSRRSHRSTCCRRRARSSAAHRRHTIFAGFQRSAQSARNAAAKVRTVGIVAGAPPTASASAISSRAASRASLTVSESSVPSVCLTTKPAHDPRLAPVRSHAQSEP